MEKNKLNAENIVERSLITNLYDYSFSGLLGTISLVFTFETSPLRQKTNFLFRQKFWEKRLFKIRNYAGKCIFCLWVLQIIMRITANLVHFFRNRY